MVELFSSCSNAGRWGEDDELGTLNFITDAKRVNAATLVRSGTVVAVGRELRADLEEDGLRPASHHVLFDQCDPVSALDFVGVAAHGFSVTHLDAVAHVSWDGQVYNGRRLDQVLTRHGLLFGSMHAQRQGIFTRGVLLDVAAARGVLALAPHDVVTRADLERAEEIATLRVESGDAVFVHVGLERREERPGVGGAVERAGLDADCVRWLHEREVSVYSGDCVEKMPYPSDRVPLPLHQVGLVAMGLCLLDCPKMTELVRVCRSVDRSEFLLTCAPLDFVGATGLPVNPLCIF